MTDCIRKGDFNSIEAHPCFIIGCNGYCYPVESETCSICNFKKCENNHCGCDLTEEARYAVNKLYETYCEFCSDKKEVVLWKLDGVEVEHKPIRTPKLSWNTLTILEKLVDSAKTSLHIQEKNGKNNFSTTYSSLNKALKILRKKIEIEKKISPQTLLKTCEFRETKRTRCNKFPTKYDSETGQYLCVKHHSSFGVIEI